ncbi:hypothetical protein CR513_19383, partial [Mucuna pruriens]
MIINSESCTNVDRKVTHDGYKNRYTLAMNKHIMLTPLKLVKVYFDQIGIARECKLRGAIEHSRKRKKRKYEENKQKKEKHEFECSKEKIKKISAFAKKKKVESALLAKEKLLVLLYKDVYFTNEFHPSFTYEVDSLLQEFTDVFLDEVPRGLPHLRGIEHQIDLIPGCPIPNRSTYRTNPEEIKEIQKQVNELLQKGFVRESLSPCSVPVILVPKKDGTWRMCIDSRAINKITSGYNQIRMKEGDEWKTTFKTKYVVSFGLTNAPSTFMRLMNHVLRLFIGKFVVVYFDDILIYSKTLDKHVEYLHVVLNVLRENKLYGNIKNSKEISVDEEKPTPKNANEKAEFVKELHVKVRANIEKRNEQYARQANKGRVMTFELGDCVWVHRRKERFPTQRKYKLQPRGDGTFQVLERINDNAYKLDLPTIYGEEFDSRMNPFEEGENDRDPTNKAKDNLRESESPMTRPKTKMIKQSLTDLSLGITESLE